MEIIPKLIKFKSVMILLWSILLTELLAEPVVHVTGSVNPVKTGGILSIHCQIWNLVDGYQVTISRQLDGESKSDQISWNEDVLPSVEDRVFLALRQIGDGSVVYFLSIIDVTEEDKGIYRCKVINTADTFAEIAADYVSIDILFFPSESFPVCDHPQNMDVYAGDDVTLNCSSNAGNPIVALTWKRTKTGTIPKSTQITQNGVTFSVLNLQPSLEDSETMYICHMSSNAFPELLKSCHVGPIKVSPPAITPESNRNDVLVPRVTPPLIHPNLAGSEATSSSTDVHQQHTPRLGESSSSKCEDMCSMLNSPVLYWILATSVAGFSAFIFFIIGITLLVKVYRLSDPHRMRPIYSCATEDIYVDLDGRRDENRVYMTLEKPAKAIVVANDRIEPEGTYTPYTRTPTVNRIH